jgi:3D (Asp-Asp-Asp) domain-containing protein
MARITAYWPGEDKWTSRGQTSTGAPLVHKTTAAIDPRLIPYGSRINIPDLNMQLKKEQPQEKEVGMNL